MVHNWCNRVPNSANTELDAGAVLRTQKARLNLCSPKEHNVDKPTAKEDADQTPSPQPSDNPDNNSDDNDNNKDKGKSSDDDKEEQAKKKEGPFVDLGYSKYQGNVLESNIHEYLGIRYAKAPTGDLRWKAPQEPESTTGTLKAQEYAPYCPGVNDGLSSRIDEDCLFANIWTPANATSDSKLPVMIFFQSGGYIRNASPYVNGTQLISASNNNIIFVNFNYRVGMFGFLASKEVKEDGDLNAGLLDQRFLLNWIQKHIEEFGGDPEHVVLHGESAGAGSVALQLVAYGGKDEGLFAGAIAESTFMPGLPSPDDLQYQFDRVVNATDCADADDTLKCLRGIKSTDLQTHNAKAPFDGRTYRSYFYWAPTTDGDMFSDLPSKLYEKGEFVKVPLLSGSCTNEGSNYAVNAGSSAQFIRYMQNEYPYLTTDDTETILDLYPQEPKIAKHDTWFPSASRAYGEATFICPTNNILNAFAEHADHKTLWSYRYNVAIEEFTNDGYGVPHVSNAPAVFGPDMTAAKAGPSYRTYNAPMVPIVQNYWISFVRSFDPNTHRDEDAPRWENWGDDQRRLVFELNNNTMESVDKGQQERCEAWLDMSGTTKQ
ncbi:triacylglycerol lipase II precursor [Fusarium pseudocircinatum]|uniref:Carboxylic ester hydrolase n=1 Tax=Fusarium pseudocircinatum TaxID=56676 RepID=A0A8H5KPZ9_9HYPO|nr:triacylglycerol lipase II precursor [Fusarium pseudocircinatum]